MLATAPAAIRYTIDPAAERLLFSDQVVDTVRSRLGGLEIKPRTVDSWRRKGLLVGDDLVQLPSLRVGRRWVSTAAAVDWFLGQTNRSNA